MKYEIQIASGEYWSLYANTHSHEVAKEIQDMLLAKGRICRINEISQNIVLGEVKKRLDS